VLFSCDNYHCNDNEEDKDSEGCCEYKNLEITGYYIIQNDYFLIKFIKRQKNPLNEKNLNALLCSLPQRTATVINLLLESKKTISSGVRLKKIPKGGKDVNRKRFLKRSY
jgi:hypothetical protein